MLLSETESVDFSDIVAKSEKQKAASGGSFGLGQVSNHVATSFDDLIDESYSHLNLKKIEKEFEFNPRTEAARLVKINAEREKKGLPIFTIPIFDDGSDQGPPTPIKPKYHPLVLRDLAESNSDVSAGLDTLAVNIGECRWILEPTRPVEVFMDDSGNQKRRYVDTKEIVPDQEWQKKLAQAEEAKAWLKNICPGKRLSEIRYDYVYDLNQIGNDFWVMLRNQGKFVAVKPIKDDATIRLCKEDRDPVQIEHRYFVGEKADSITISHHFQRFVQSLDGKRIYYKSFGDKRFLDRNTGKYYPSAKEAPENAVDAAELWHHKLHGIDYGVPKWTPALYQIQTNKGAQLTTRETMNNSGVAKMIMVLINCNDDKLESSLKKSVNKIRQSGSKEMVMVVRLKPEEHGVAPDSQPITPEFRIERLSNQQEKEGMYLQMQKHNQQDIGVTLRIPDLYYGRSSDSMNRATAGVLMSTAEKQVFQPGRSRFDDFMNDVVFVERGYNYWRFRSQSSDINDTELYIAVLKLFAENGGIIPNELRSLGDELLDLSLPGIDASWAKLPKYISTMDTLVRDGAQTGDGSNQSQSNQDPSSVTTKMAGIGIDQIAVTNTSQNDVFAQIGKDVVSKMGVKDADVFIFKAADI